MAEKEKNRLLALVYTAGIYTVVILLLFFAVAFRLPNPPLPDGGSTINLGFDDQGSGDVQPDEPVGTTDKQETPAEEPKPQEPAQEEPKEEKQATKPVEQTPDEDLLAGKEESPVVVKEKKEEPKPIEKPKEEPKRVEPKKEEPKKEEPKKENPVAVYKPSTKPDPNATTGDGRQGKPGNQGDDVGKVGDKGDPNGSPDAKALYGKPGTGSGTGPGDGVSMSGFKGFDWPTVETPSLPDQAQGVYEFIVKVDAEGTVMDVKAVQRGLSLEAERKLKAIIQQLEFTPKGINLPPMSEGRITFKVVSK